MVRKHDLNSFTLSSCDMAALATREMPSTSQSTPTLEAKCPPSLMLSLFALAACFIVEKSPCFLAPMPWNADVSQGASSIPDDELAAVLTKAVGGGGGGGGGQAGGAEASESFTGHAESDEPGDFGRIFSRILCTFAPNFLQGKGFEFQHLVGQPQPRTSTQATIHDLLASKGQAPTKVAWSDPPLQVCDPPLQV